MNKNTLTHTPADLATGALNHATRSIMGMVGMGLYFLKASAHFGAQGRRRDLVQRVALSDGEDAPEGFKQWIQETFQAAPFSLSTRTAYNYMRMASRLGLTEASTEDDLAALEKSRALEGKTVRSLTSPADEKDPSRPRPADPEIDPAQLLLPFENDLDDLLAPQSHASRALPLLSLPKLEDMERKLRTALDLVTEAKNSARRGAKKEAK